MTEEFEESLPNPDEIKQALVNKLLLEDPLISLINEGNIEKFKLWLEDGKNIMSRHNYEVVTKHVKKVLLEYEKYEWIPLL